jgi:hypothetical protein
MIALGLVYKVKGKKLSLNANFLVLYCGLCACNMPVTKFFVDLLELLTGASINLYSTYYTICAMISAVVIPFLWQVVTTNISASFEIKKNGGESNDKKKAA